MRTAVGSLSWVEWDARMAIAARGTHSFAQSAVAVLIAIYLGLHGFSLVRVGAFLTAGAVGAALAAVVAGVLGDAIGRRRTLVTLSGLMAVVPEYSLHRKSLILPPEGSTLDGTIGQQRLAFARESPKPCEELPGMERHPSAWMTELVEGVAGCMEAHSPIGALGWRYHEDEELLELSVYPTPVKLVGGEHDGAIVMPGFSLDVLALQAVFERVTALHWHAQDFGPDDEDGPHLLLEGTYQGHLVWLRVLAEAPDDEEPGLELDTSASP